MRTHTLTRLAALGVIGAFGASAAFADPPHCPPDQAKKGQCYAAKFIPRAHQAYQQGYWDGQRNAEWRLGDRLPDHLRYDVIRDYGRYDLRAPPIGHYYARVDGDYLLIEAATRLVIAAMRR